MNQESPDIEILQRRIVRERAARMEAERLLEEKSREVFLANEELRRLADRAKQQAEQLCAIVENVGEGIITYNESGEILSFNAAAERIFGCSEDEGVSRLIGEFAIDLKPAKLTTADDEDYRTRASRSFEQVGRKMDGTRFPIEVTVSRFAFAGQQINTALIRDRTARKRLEQQLVHAKKMESVGQLAAGIAHEINTPMQFVGDNTRFLSEAFADIERLLSLCAELPKGVNKADRREKLIADIGQAVVGMELSFLRDEIPSATQQTLDGIERVTNIVQALKEFSHPGGQDKIEIDLNRAIHSSIEVSRNQWKYVAELETDLDEELPFIAGYPSEINQVILNLLVNAAQAIQERPQAGVGKIRVSTRYQDGRVAVCVSDNGIGMTDEIKAKMFDPFFTTKRLGEGTGQGLAICYAVVVDKHGGQIECESTVGRGTTFTIRLQAAAADQSN